MRISVNVAMSIDGKIASILREQLVISGPSDFDRVDSLRAQYDAIMVGVQTILADDPKLLIRSEDLNSDRIGRGMSAHPARIVVDSLGRTPNSAQVMGDDARTFILLSEIAEKERIQELKELGATTIVSGEERVDIESAMKLLKDEGIENILVEGGGELIFTLMNRNLVDLLTVYIAPMIIGGENAPTLADGEGFVDKFPRFTLTQVQKIDDGVVLFFKKIIEDRS
jgi:2,5-diamino-6-(ribosylamino)-4(3H)-pyrimidinone 5'-phosphate reductase